MAALFHSLKEDSALCDPDRYAARSGPTYKIVACTLFSGFFLAEAVSACSILEQVKIKLSVDCSLCHCVGTQCRAWRAQEGESIGNGSNRSDANVFDGKPKRKWRVLEVALIGEEKNGESRWVCGSRRAPLIA